MSEREVSPDGKEKWFQRVDKVCPKCGRNDYMVSIGALSEAYNYKCLNCNSYFRFDELFWGAKPWTPIKNSPPYDMDVLLYTKSGNQIVGHRVNEWGEDGYTDGKLGSGLIFPTHWTYLPKEPEE